MDRQIQYRPSTYINEISSKSRHEQTFDAAPDMPAPAARISGGKGQRHSNIVNAGIGRL
jgi:hypothetical protein